MQDDFHESIKIESVKFNSLSPLGSDDNDGPEDEESPRFAASPHRSARRQSTQRVGMSPGRKTNKKTAAFPRKMNTQVLDFMTCLKGLEYN